MTVVFNEEEQRYECRTDLVLCHTVSGEGEDVPGAKALMEKLLPTVPEIDAKCRGLAADELLETKNDEWLDEDEEPPLVVFLTVHTAFNSIFSVIGVVKSNVAPSFCHSLKV